MKVKLEEVDRFERDVNMRLAFRFGVITVTDATQAVISVRVVAARRAAPAKAWRPRRWRPSGSRRARDFTDAQNLDQLRQSLDLAIDHYTRAGLDNAFGLFAGTYAEQQKRGAALGLNPLVAAYGPALLDRAILDALGKRDGPIVRRR